MSIAKRRTELLGRWMLAGPVAIIAAVLAMASTPLWFPPGVAGIDNLVFAILLFPAYWGLFFFYPLIDGKVWRAAMVMAAVVIVNAVVVYLQF